MANSQIVIPYGSPAGERAYEVMKKIAERLWTQAQEATTAFVEENFPIAKTMREWVENEEYRREIKANRQTYIISYRFREKTVTSTGAGEVLEKCS